MLIAASTRCWTTGALGFCPGLSQSQNEAVSLSFGAAHTTVWSDEGRQERGTAPSPSMPAGTRAGRWLRQSPACGGFEREFPGSAFSLLTVQNRPVRTLLAHR